jgi:general secretion pathway protein D
MIFLRPTLVRDSQRADAFTGERYDYIIGEQGKVQPEHDPVLPDMNSPTLPPRALSPSAIEVKPPQDGGM